MAAIEILSDKAIQAAIKVARAEGKAKTLNDGGGLSIQIQPSEVGWWRLRYWIDSRENRLSLGTYPEVSLTQARRRCKEARALVADGTDPSQKRKADNAEKAAKARAQKLAEAGAPLPGTFEAVAREWIDTVHRVKVSEGHAAKTLVRFVKDVFPSLGRRPVGEIEPPELLKCLRKIEARGAIETAHRAKDSCGQVFRYAIALGLCQRDPAADLRDAMRPVQSRHHAAIVDPAGTGALLRDVMGYQGNPITRAALVLSPLLLLRPGELRHMEWAWIDMEGATLTVPGEVMKRTKADKENGPPHVVALAPQALAVLRELQPLTGHGRFVFPSMLTGERCMSDNTVRSALRRLGYGNDEMTAHGFRAMARTLIAERLGIAPEVIEAQLAHAVADALGRAYNRTQYLEQRRDMMCKWADYLDALRDGAKVIPIRAA